LQLEFSGGQIPQGAVWPVLVIIDPPCLDDLSDLVKAHEPILVQAFITELAVEALHVAIIHRFAGSDELEFDPSSVSPGVERVTDELRTVIDDNLLR
jgi:hypothetical protein